MILIGQYDSPFTRRVAVTMNVYAMAFERRVLSVFGDFDEMLTLNPLGKPQIDCDSIRTPQMRSMTSSPTSAMSSWMTLSAAIEGSKLLSI
jgi:hypothetical protein